jgi:hypothetical protein
MRRVVLELWQDFKIYTWQKWLPTVMVCINVEHMLRCCELSSVWNAVCNYKCASPLTISGHEQEVYL